MPAHDQNPAQAFCPSNMLLVSHDVVQLLTAPIESDSQIPNLLWQFRIEIGIVDRQMNSELMVSLRASRIAHVLDHPDCLRISIISLSRISQVSAEIIVTHDTGENPSLSLLSHRNLSRSQAQKGFWMSVQT